MKFFLLAVVALSICFDALAQGVAPTNSVPPGVHPLRADGIDNFYQLTGRIYSGSAPEGDAAFAALKELGIKTIITVDGAKPDVSRAEKFGLRYVHLPIGYDGVPVNAGVRLVKAAETLPGPIYVHCHHGLHRGPAGAAVICMGMEGWTPEAGEAWLKLAGTSTNYTGLYKSVRQFQPPTPERLKQVSADFPATATISPLADVMVQIDERFDHVKLIKKAGYHAPSAHPDLDPGQEALLLDELFRELRRSPITEKRAPDFRARLAAAEKAAAAFRSALNHTPPASRQADGAFQKLSDACVACHKLHRN